MKIYSAIFRGLRRYLLAGLAILFPVFISLYLIYLLFSISERFAGRLINSYLKDAYGFIIPGLGFFIILIVLIITGMIATRLIGRKIFSFFEAIVMKMPLVANLYPPAKQLSDFLFKSDKRKKFRKVALIEFPYKGAYSIGFVTNEEIELLDKAAGTELVSVFMPLAPSPFSGFIILVPRDAIKQLDMPFETAIKYIVSGGIVFKKGGADG